MFNLKSFKNTKLKKMYIFLDEFYAKWFLYTYFSWRL